MFHESLAVLLVRLCCEAQHNTNGVNESLDLIALLIIF